MNKEKKKLEKGFCKGTITDETLTKANAILVIKCANLEQQCKKQKEVIDNIKKCFDDGHFEDYCDCLIIEKYINNYLKEASE